MVITPNESNIVNNILNIIFPWFRFVIEPIVEPMLFLLYNHHTPDPELMCGQRKIQIGLDLRSLISSGLNGSSGHLADPQCSSFTERDGTVWYQVDRQADTCGNTLTVRICLIPCCWFPGLSSSAVMF